MIIKKIISKFVKLIVKYKLKFQFHIGKKAINKINSGKSWSFLEIFLPNNLIYPKLELIFMRNAKLEISKNITVNNFLKPNYKADSNKIINYEATLPDSVLFLTPKFYGRHPNIVWWNFYEHLFNLGVKVTWIDILDNKLNKKFDLANAIDLLFSDQSGRNILFLDPLDATDIFVEYRDVNNNFFENLKSRKNFQLIGPLGDIWREKDKVKIINAETYFDGFIHIDRIAAEKYPKKVKDKLFFYPFVALNSNNFVPQIKESILFYSGQVRDADRRYWLRNLIDISKKYGIVIENYAWYLRNEENSLEQAKYVKKLNSVQYSLSLTQKGVGHWLATARAFQSLQSGCTLIHQESPKFNMFNDLLSPYIDYLPFTNVRELCEVIEFIAKYPIEAKQIGNNGASNIRSVFHEANLWKFCLNSR